MPPRIVEPEARADPHDPGEWLPITVQIAPANGDYPGRVALGRWRVSGRVLTLEFEDGRETTHMLHAGDDAFRTARDLLRAEYGAPGRLRSPITAWRKMPHKDPEARRRYLREWETKRRRARCVPVLDNSNSIERLMPWEERGISRRH